MNIIGSVVSPKIKNLIESKGYETDEMRKLVTYRKSDENTGYNTEDV